MIAFPFIASPCLLYATIVKDNKVIQCDSSKSCNKLNYVDYKYLQITSDPWYCISCCNSIFPFKDLNEQNFNSFIRNNSTIRKTKKPILIEIASNSTSTLILNHLIRKLKIILIMPTLEMMIVTPKTF